jgi:Flp pilus assembly protein TadD
MSTPILSTLHRAKSLHEQGDVEGALKCCFEVLEHAPANPQANLMAGVLLESVGHSAEALPHLRWAVAHEPDDAELRDLLACCLVNQGCAEEAITHLRQVVAAQPQNASARFNLGRALLDCRNHAEAERVYLDYVRDSPGDAEAFSHLGLARLGQRDAAGAEPCFRAAIRILPQDPLFHLNLARALADQDRDDSARETFTIAVRLDPGSAEIRCVTGWFELSRGNMTAADTHFGSAHHLAPLSAEAAAGLATVKVRRGALDEAHALLKPQMDTAQIDPMVAVAYAELCRARSEGRRALVPVRRALRGTITREEEAALRFAEGDILDCMNEPDAAFDAYRKGNDAQAFSYSPMAHRTLVDQLIETFDRDFFERCHQPATDTTGSVLVVGMPQAGTRLMARLLDAHPGIHDAGALDDIPTMARGIARFVRGDETYPSNMAAMTPELVDRLSEARVESLRRASDAKLVLDSTWFNFLHLGLIAAVSPGARVIHCVRDPVETCLSCYFKHFTVSRYAFSNNLNALAGFYREYHRLMRHWREVLPIDILDVDFEDLVADSGEVHARMMEFMGLEWIPDVHGPAPSVTTLPGMAQAVTEPSTRYGHRLGPLRGLAVLG